MNLSLKQLEAFIWVAELGSFRRAADRLNTTQPNISSRIAALESALNVTLMERDAGSVRLTVKGRDLLRHASQVLEATEALIEAADDASLFEGVLRLGVTEMIVHTWLRRFLKVLKDRFPNITVELTVDMSVSLSKELFDRSIDLALQSGPFTRQSTGSQDLGAYPWIWVASPELGLGSAKKVSLSELMAYPLLTHARNSGSYEEICAHLRAHRDLSPRLVPSSNLAACLHMTVDGMGVATTPAAMVSKELATGELVVINYDWVPESLHFFARYDAEKSSRVVAEAAKIAREVSADFVAVFEVGKTH